MQTLGYLEFQSAQARHGRSPGQLSQTEKQSIRQEALRQWQLEEQILNTPEALACIVEPACLEQALATIRNRYPDRASFLVDLAANALDETLLRDALGRELRVEAVLARVAAAAPRVTEQDAEIFYWQHLERFSAPEKRLARHILITINETLAGNRRDEALARVEGLATELAGAPERFADLALKHSECPTALQGGELGWVMQGQLYPELDAALFQLMASQMSSIVESPLGFHLLLCDKIQPAENKSFTEIKSKLVANLQSSRERREQRLWVRHLAK